MVVRRRRPPIRLRAWTRQRISRSGKRIRYSGQLSQLLLQASQRARRANPGGDPLFVLLAVGLPEVAHEITAEFPDSAQ